MDKKQIDKWYGKCSHCRTRNYQISTAGIFGACEEDSLTSSKAEKALENGVIDDRTVEHSSFSTGKPCEAKRWPCRSQRWSLCRFSRDWDFSSEIPSHQLNRSCNTWAPLRSPLRGCRGDGHQGGSHQDFSPLALLLASPPACVGL